MFELFKTSDDQCLQPAELKKDLMVMVELCANGWRPEGVILLLKMKILRHHRRSTAASGVEAPPS